MSIGKFLLRFIPPNLLADISFHNFHNAITACYIASKDFKLRRVNSFFLKTFNLTKKDTENMTIQMLFKLINLPEEQINLFKDKLIENGFVRFPEIKLIVNDEERYFSLFSTYTTDIHLSYLSGIQGQFIDRTNEVLLRLKAEKLAKELSEKQVKIDEQNENLTALSTKLAKYLSPQVYGSIFTGEKQVSIAFERKKLTIFFSDIKNFAATTDSMESEELANLLNHYLDRMTKIALKHGGTIDKYIGDAILIFYGDPESRGEEADALHCIRMAIEMRSLMSVLRDEWFSSGISNPLHIRIGINTGYCTVGNFGSEERLDYTIVGGQVNLASRLEHIAEIDTILISHETYGLIKDEVFCKPKEEVKVKGIGHNIKTYEVIDFYSELKEKKKIIDQSFEGFKILLDGKALKKKEQARLILRNALKLIEEES